VPQSPKPVSTHESDPRGSVPGEIDVAGRVESFARGSDLGEVARILAQRRDEIVGRWVEVTSRQAFHQGRRQRVLADHIPQLFDALVALLQRSAARSTEHGPPLDDPAVLRAARDHARTRFEQGLQAADIVAEFRLLRQEIGRALRLHLPSDVPTGDVIGAELLVHDALDGAISLALSALSRQVEEMRDEVLATTVHDIQQPMTTIKANQQLALRALGGPQPDVARAIDTIRRAEAEMNRMVALLGGLADASRLALGRLELHRAPTNLVELLRNAAGRLDPDTAARVKLDLTCDINAIGEWDPAFVERVLANLLSNAIKYSPPGMPVDAIVWNEGEAVHLAVRDRGMGLAPDELERLFQRYARSRGAVQQGTQGLGLGLYLSKRIIEAHGGRIWAESPGRNQGTTLHVLLPRSAPDQC
jgi:signal transduction histidine kinase